MKDLKKKEWDKSYKNFDNTLFYPKEDVIRFVNKYFKRINSVQDFKEVGNKKNILDLGSGSGRHLIYLYENNFNPYGVELSKIACEQALELIKYKNYPIPSENIKNESAHSLSFTNNFFDACIAVSTLDSMTFETARLVMKELKRVMKNNSFIFLDLISDNFIRKGNIDTSFDQIVAENHEKGTVQSYFNQNKINILVSGFIVSENYRVDKVSSKNEVISSRNFLILKVQK